MVLYKATEPERTLTCLQEGGGSAFEHDSSEVNWAKYAELYDELMKTEVYQALLRDISNRVLSDADRHVNILDLGSGTGNLLSFLIERAGEIGSEFTYHGFDSNSAMIERAAKKFPDMSFQPVDFDSEPERFEALLHELLSEESINVFVLSNVLYALKDPRSLLLTIKQSLVPRSRLVISNPRKQSSVRAIIVQEYLLRSKKLKGMRFPRIQAFLNTALGVFEQRNLIEINRQIAKRSSIQHQNGSFLSSDEIGSILTEEGNPLTGWNEKERTEHYGAPPQNQLLVFETADSESVDKWIEKSFGVFTVAYTPKKMEGLTDKEAELLFQAKETANIAYARSHGSPEKKAEARRVIDQNGHGNKIPIVLTNSEGQLLATMTADPSAASFHKYFTRQTQRDEAGGDERVGEIGIYAKASLERKRSRLESIIDSEVVLYHVLRQLKQQGCSRAGAVMNSQMERYFLREKEIEGYGVRLPPYDLLEVEAEMNIEQVDADLLRRDFPGYWGGESGEKPRYGPPKPFLGNIDDAIGTCLKRLSILKEVYREHKTSSK